jgi:AGCS family alanine or glycine:cation symporter
LGNIAGVAVAIAIGGPGATLWMIIAGLLGMSSKFVECTLGVKYRDIEADGTVYGGPMYYLSKVLKTSDMRASEKYSPYFSP